MRYDYKGEEVQPKFSKAPCECGGGTNAHTKISCIEQYNKNEQNNEIKNTNSTTSAIDQEGLNTSTDSPADRNLGATHISKSMCLKDCKLTYQDLFYRISNGKLARGGVQRIPNAEVELLYKRTQTKQSTDFQQETASIAQGNSKGERYNGFPISINRGNWCTSLKTKGFSDSTEKQGADINIVSLMGIAYDEPIRIKKHIQKPNVFLPLVATGMWEKDCYKWCEENDLLSPIYSGATRGGVGFAITKVLTNYENSAKNIQTFGNYF